MFENHADKQIPYINILLHIVCVYRTQAHDQKKRRKTIKLRENTKSYLNRTDNQLICQ